MIKILILCTGNSCRSQMAQGLLQALDAGLFVFSGGTQPAERVNEMAVDVMREIGIDISSHVPTSVERYLDECWDYVITVCGNARDTCPHFTGHVSRQLHIGFDDPSKATGSAAYVHGEFVRVRDEIRREMTRFYLTEIQHRTLPRCTCNHD